MQIHELKTILKANATLSGYAVDAINQLEQMNAKLQQENIALKERISQASPAKPTKEEPQQSKQGRK